MNMMQVIRTYNNKMRFLKISKEEWRNINKKIKVKVDFHQ